MSHPQDKIAFGDFQTPLDLAIECCKAIKRDLGGFDCIVEPTCGVGAFVEAASMIFQPAAIYANEINRDYISDARSRLISPGRTDLHFKSDDFFQVDWNVVRESFGNRSTLFLGNPPWVTNSELGRIDSKNLPIKSNFDGLRGIEALTGHGNFDISENILRTLIAAMQPRNDAIAFIVKAASARKVIRAAWKANVELESLAFYPIDAKRDFGVNVDAVLVTARRACPSQQATRPPESSGPRVCLQSKSLDSSPSTPVMGWVNCRIVSDPVGAEATQRFEKRCKGLWRSGIKHDASKVLELRRSDGELTNGFGHIVDIEPNRLYPLLKGSDVANSRSFDNDRFVLVTQQRTNEDTAALEQSLPLTFRYLDQHSQALANRKSSIYRNRDRFAIFGVGQYTFRPWKVAICGLYKRLQFSIYGPSEDRPVVFDDTVAFVGLENDQQAKLLRTILDSDPANQFFESRIFWDAKRPITIDLLQSIDLEAVAEKIGVAGHWRKLGMHEAISSLQN